MVLAFRVGYTMANEEIISSLNKVRNPFNVNALAQVAAMEALADQDFIVKAHNLNKEGKEYIYKSFDEMGISYAPSETNHIFFDSGYDTFKLFNALQSRGVIIRPMMGNFARVSIGTMEENKIFIDTLKEVFKEFSQE
jgi:histidinol-phosphate aminotransferase